MVAQIGDIFSNEMWLAILIGCFCCPILGLVLNRVISRIERPRTRISFAVWYYLSAFILLCANWMASWNNDPTACWFMFIVALGPGIAFCYVLAAVISRLGPLYPRGHCRRCGYNLTGNVSGICPECGQPIVSPDYCQACGRTLLGLVVEACPECGTRIMQDENRGSGTQLQTPRPNAEAAANHDRNTS